MKLFLKFNWACCHQIFLLAILFSFNPAATAADLFNGKDLTGWRKPTGVWMAAKSVSLDPTNSDMFLLTPGEGILANGAKGNSVNLISVPEFGDVEAHVEFWIPKHSNSGVYLMGRYEIQIYDS